MGQLLVPIGSTNGQVGGFLYTNVAPALCVGQRVLYLGDHDWQGSQIEANSRRVLEREVGGGLLWERLAITEEQVATNDLPVISKPFEREQAQRVRMRAALRKLARGTR